MRITTNNSWSNQLKPFLAFLLLGFLIFVPPIYMSSLPQTIYKISLPILMFLTSIVLGKTRRMEKYSQVVYAFFISSTVSLFEYLLYHNQSSLYWLSSSRIELIVYFKIISVIIVVIPIIILTKASGQGLSTLYLN
jgi:hypothetical protein